VTSPALTPAVLHARRGVDRARARCLKAWNAWLDATEDRRKALEILAEAERDARRGVGGAT